MAVDKSKLVGAKISMFAEIGDTADRYDIVSYTSSFEINTIPSGSVLIPVGYVVGTGAPAEIMTKFAQFTAKQPIKIYLTITTDFAEYGPGLEMFEDGFPQLIFEGKVTGAILRRTDKTLHIVAHFVHWLNELNNSSVLSATSHVANPVALYDQGAELAYQGAGVGSSTTGSGAACSFENKSGEAHWSVAATSVNLMSGASDLWTDALQPFLRCIVSADALDPNVSKWMDEANAKQKRIEALNKVVSGGLVLDSAIADQLVTQNISDGIRAGVRDVDASNTIWGLLVGGWGPSYFFAICPRVTDAILAPLVGSYRDPADIYKTIEAGDYYSIELNLSARQSIGMVGMITPNTQQTGVPLSANLVDWPGLFPRLPAATAGLTKYGGVFLTRNLPFWLANMAFEPPSAAPTAAPVTAFGPLLSSGLSIAATAAAASRTLKYRNLADRFAQFFYVNEVFNNRSGDISGKLRFDICPGTSLKVQAVALDPSLASTFDQFYGQVIRVSYTIDAVQGIASTVFTLSNLRTQAEVGDDIYSIEKPPLYATAWTGDTLLKELP
jgi:hypothetical protein